MVDDLQKLIDENRKILGDPQLFESMAKNPIFWKRFMIKTLPQGHGSGLDADTVDGYHADDFLQRLAMKHLAMGGGGTGGVTKHIDLMDKEVAGIIDHADRSVTPRKIYLASSTSPDPPYEGMLWYDSIEKAIKVYQI